MTTPMFAAQCPLAREDQSVGSDEKDIEAGENQQDAQHAEIASPPSDSGDADRKLTKQAVLAYIAIAFENSAVVMSLLIPSSSLSYINADLGPDPNYTWITVSWTLGAAVVVSVAGRLSDIFGRRYFMLFGAFVSIVGLLVGANGTSVNMMIVSGVLLGIGSGHQEMSHAIVQELVPNKYRVYAIGTLIISAIIAYLSPLISYSFIGYYSIGWRAAYWFMFSWHMFGFILVALFYHPPDFGGKHEADSKTKIQFLVELDYVGLLLFAASIVLFLLGLSWGGQKSWTGAAVITPIIVGIACGAALGFWEAYADLQYPLLPPRLFRKVREFDMILAVCFVSGMLTYSMNVLWPKESQLFFITSTTPVAGGVYAIVFPLGSWLGGVFVATLSCRLHRERWQLVFFVAAQTALIGSLASVGLDDKAQAIATVLVAAAVIMPPELLSFAMLSLTLDDQDDMGIAVGLATTFNLLGGSVATTIYSAILSNKFSQVRPSKMADAINDTAGVAYSEGLLQSLVSAASANTAAAYEAVKGATPALAAAAATATKLAYVDAFRLVYLVVIAFGAVAMACSLLTVSTDRRLKTMDKAVYLKGEGSGGGAEGREANGFSGNTASAL